jgi:hypothetical protein
MRSIGVRWAAIGSFPSQPVKKWPDRDRFDYSNRANGNVNSFADRLTDGYRLYSLGLPWPYR